MKDQLKGNGGRMCERHGRERKETEKERELALGKKNERNDTRSSGRENRDSNIMRIDS